ncbi:MAG TPA: hypothetical protein VK359_07755 [Rubrobacteraceae bacterium]|nr:hypothetical protein [Rubrobacteraceae bacterium]
MRPTFSTGLHNPAVRDTLRIRAGLDEVRDRGSIVAQNPISRGQIR